MKIAIICDVLGRENNGTTIAAMNLIRYMKSHGHDVVVVCPDEGQSADDGYMVVKKLNLGPLNGYVENVGVCLAAPDEKVICEAIKGADVVHLVTPFLITHKALKLARELDLPITASFHCQAENVTSHLFLMRAARVNSSVYKFFYNSFYQYCDAVHYPTQFICDLFENEVGSQTNHYVISNGVNKRFAPAEVPKPEAIRDKYVILFSGRYCKEKSHSVLIDGVSKSKYADRIQLVFAGTGPLYKKLSHQAEEKLVNQPIFKFFSRQEMLEVLNYSDLYVHPAEIEIEAIACLEAICCGLVPLIANSPKSATKAFAIWEQNLFDYNDPQSLADGIDWWIEHPEEKERCRMAYEGYSRQFDQDACMEKMEQMFCDVIKEKRNLNEKKDPDSVL